MHTNLKGPIVVLFQGKLVGSFASLPSAIAHIRWFCDDGVYLYCSSTDPYSPAYRYVKKINRVESDFQKVR